MLKKTEKKNKKVFVAMSGGVDSSVAALLLKKEGYDVVGVFMKNWGEPLGEGERCQWERDQKDAREVAAVLKIPFYTFDFEKDYKKKVADYMLAEYKKGRTPNPDVMCNKEIKFGLFLGRALKLGADFVATGHYVKLKSKNEKGKIKIQLFQAKDKNKDQSYFLWTLTQKQLKYCLFPIGDYLKPEVREIAKKAWLPTAEKKDSQGVCFVGKFDFAEFLKKKIKPKKGKIIDIDSGEIIG
ncbi:MAG: tRNA 2-thiouridine(34) synthase MnmA [Patescibacteria group bacterium]